MQLRSPHITLAAVLLPLLVVTAGAQASGPDRSSPEAAVRGYFAAVDVMDLLEASHYVAGAKQGEVLKTMSAEARGKAQPRLKMTLGESRVTGDRAEVKATIALLRGNDPPPITELIRLAKSADDGWRILPPSLEELKQMEKGGKEPGPLSTMAYAISHPEILERNWEGDKMARCRQNVKELCTGMRMFTEDEDRKFAIRAEKWKDTIMPYVRSEQAFRCPRTSVDGKGPVTYSFNHHLQGVPVSRVKSPATTVMLYEGAKGQLSFRHRGQAVVAFVDSSIRLVGKQEAAKLRWKP